MIETLLVEPLIPSVLILLLVSLILRVALMIELKIDRIVAARGFMLPPNLLN